MSLENARKEIIEEIQDKVRYYQSMVDEYGKDHIGIYPPPEGAVTWGERAEAHVEAAAVLEATWQRGTHE